MSLFKRKNTILNSNNSILAELALQAIHDGVIIIDLNGIIRSANAAAIHMLDYVENTRVVGIDFRQFLKLESFDGQSINLPFGQALDDFRCVLVSGGEQKISVSISVFVADKHRVIVFRDITKELNEDREKTEFISTASHEMRTPVASIEGYLSLALNPQTATIDERARKYLNSAHEASSHLGRLFQDLLDTTKLDDYRLVPKIQPVDLCIVVRDFLNNFAPQFQSANINAVFVPDMNNNSSTLRPSFYAAIDLTFMGEILGNLFDNAKKYSPNGGNVYINVNGDDNNVVISIQDSGIGISNTDLPHIFQKFYRVDNSDTRIIGGTGLGLYLVKQRTAAMGGKVWAESVLGSGTTFYVSFPRLSSSEYAKRVAIFNNQQQFVNGEK